MKLQVERDPLAEAVAWTARALPARPTAPVLAGMRLQAGSELTLSTFDYEVSAQSTIPVQADEPGTVLVSGRLLAEIVRSLPARPVDLSTDGTRTTVKCGSATFTLMLLPAEEYPTLPDMPETTGTVGADAFASAIHQVAIAAGKDDTLPALTGIRMEINEDTLTLVATDRYRLAVRELRWTPVAPGLNTAVLVPARVLGDTARQMTGGAEVASRSPRRGRQRRHHRLRGRRPQDHNPAAVRRVPPLPDPAAERVLRGRRAARRAVRGRGQARRPRRRAEHPCSAHLRRGEVLLEAGTGDEAQASEAIGASFDGETMQIAFNPQYLLDGINAVDSDTVRISFTTATRPAVITGKGEATPTTATSSCRFGRLADQAGPQGRASVGAAAPLEACT